MIDPGLSEYADDNRMLAAPSDGTGPGSGPKAKAKPAADTKPKNEKTDDNNGDSKEVKSADERGGERDKQDADFGEGDRSKRAGYDPATAAGGGGEDLVAVEIEADRDVARCAAEQSDASNCCGDPLSCTDRLNSYDAASLRRVNSMLNGGARQGGLTDYCRQMNSLGYNGGNVNNGLSSICFGSHSSCAATCGSLEKKYTRKLEDCDECDSESIYRSALRNLASARQACSNMQSRSDQLAATGLGTANNQAVADYCGQVASTPSGGSGMPMPRSNSPYINSLLAANCDNNPSSADCRGVNREVASGKAAAQGSTGFRAGAEDGKKGFNVPDVSGGYRGYGGNSLPDTQNPTASKGGVKVAPPPNNSGGAIPGGSGEARAPSAAAALNQQALGRGHGTDVDGGFSSGGGYSQPSGGAGAGADDDGRNPFSIPIADSGSQFKGLDLRQFLPGGSRAALRRLVDANGINSKDQNIFVKITNKMMEKCRLGLLWQCH